jgi:hypothetical protein
MQVFIAGAVFASTVWAAEPFLGATEVAGYAKTPDRAQVRATQCRSIKRDDASYADCWAAQTAVRLQDESPLTQELVFDPTKRRQIFLQCQAMSMKEVLESRECRALNQASNFLMLIGSPKGNTIRF